MKRIKNALVWMLCVILLVSSVGPVFASTVNLSVAWADPTENAQTQESGGEETAPTFTLDKTSVTMQSKLRPLTLKVHMEPYNMNERNHWVCTSSDPSVVTVEKISNKAMSAQFPAQIKLWAVGPGKATITISPSSEFTSTPKYQSATCEVTVTQEASTWGKSLEEINKMNVEDVVKLQVYDGRDLDIMTAVNLQIGGICTAEGHIAAMETSLVKQGILTKEAADIHERNLVYRYYNHGGDDPLNNTQGDMRTNANWQNEPLRTNPVAAFMTQWNGPTHDPGTGNPELYQMDGYAGCIGKPEDIVYVSGERDELKRLIVQYGAVAIGYRSSTEAMMYHHTSSKATNGMHVSAIVGWDDTVEKENFTSGGKTLALHDGAWIVKNSWGDAHGDGHGYLYLSYDSSLERPIVYKMMSKDAYEFNYFYDGVVENDEYWDTVSLGSEEIAAVSFQAQKGTKTEDEYLEAVNVGFGYYNSTVQVEVYTDVPESSLKGDALDPLNGTKAAASGERYLERQGYYTIKLDQPVRLEPGHYFTIVVKIAGGGSIISSQEKSKNDLTFVRSSDGHWRNTSHNTLRIKGYTNLHRAEDLEEDYTIYPEAVALEPAALTMAEGDTTVLAATVTPENALDTTLSWESSAEDVVTVDRSGRLTAVGIGQATVTVKTWNGKTAFCVVTVTAKSVPVASVALDKTELTLTEGDAAALVATVLPENATDKSVTWKSSDEGVVTVTENGQLTAKAPGEAKITVTTKDGGKTASCTVTVKAKVIPVESVTLDKAELTLTEGNTASLTATVLPENATDKSVTWQSSDEAVVTVTENGQLTAKAPGEAKITVTTTDGGKTATCTVTVKAKIIPVESVTLDKTELTLTEGDTATLVATVLPENATDKSMTWKSSDETVVAVGENGQLTAKAPGEAKITVTTTDGGKTATCTVTVKAKIIPVESVTLDKTELTLTEGDTGKLNATVTPDNATDKSVTWKSSNETIVTVDENGQLTAKAPGEAKITVTTTDGDKTASCTVTVKAKVIPVESVTLDKTELTLTEGDTATLTATVLPENATDKSVTWQSSDEGIVTVTENGQLTAKAPGEAKITVTTTDGGKTASCTVTVKAKIIPVESVTLDKTELALTEGDTASLTATVLPENATDKSVTWKSSDETVVAVGENGQLTAKAPGEAKITVTTADGGKTASCTVTVKAKVIPVESVTLDKTELTLTEGDTASLTATVLPENATDKSVTWKSSDETIVTVDGSGNLKAIAPGTAEITVTTTDGGKTAVCQVTVPPHDFTGPWKTDEESHWHECACGAVGDKAPHTFQWVTDRAPTEDTAGSRHEECTVCGYVRGENTPIDPLGHEMTHHPEEKATCTAPGCREYWRCDRCQKLFADPQGETELQEADLATPMLPHTFGEWVVTKEATKEAEGEKTRTCAVCGYAETEKMERLSDSPKTGDKGLPEIAALLLAVSAMAIGLLIARKKRMG